VNFIPKLQHWYSSPLKMYQIDKRKTFNTILFRFKQAFFKNMNLNLTQITTNKTEQSKCITLQK